VENLRFLTTEQTLADLAHFIAALKSNNTDARVIVAGQGYGGNLAVWFRQKYPHLVDGVWSSRGGLKAKLDFEGFYWQVPGFFISWIVDFSFPEYVQFVEEKVAREGSGGCVATIRRAFRILQNLVDGGRSEYSSNLFNLCDPVDLNEPKEVTGFYQMIAMQTIYGILMGS
jgi:serine protease 16